MSSNTEERPVVKPLDLPQQNGSTQSQTIDSSRDHAAVASTEEPALDASEAKHQDATGTTEQKEEVDAKDDRETETKEEEETETLDLHEVTESQQQASNAESVRSTTGERGQESDQKETRTIDEETIAKSMAEKWAPWKDINVLGSCNTPVEYRGEKYILGIDPSTLNRAIVGWNASNCDLEQLRQRLQRLRALQILVIRDTSLMSLQDLEVNPFITSIEATGNRLQNVLDFRPLERSRCQYEEEKQGGVITVTDSCVEYANLSNNNISELNDISQHASLQILKLSGNQISRIHDLSSLSFLRHLDLSNNSLSSVEELVTADRLVSLDISGNEICTLEPLKRLQYLERLDAANNLLTHLEGLQGCKLLYELVCSQNKIETVYDIEPLVQLSLLSHVDTRDNPFHDDDLCRLRTLYRLPLLATLDGQTVEDEERVRAKNLHGYDAPIRKSNFHKYLPQEMFTDISVQIDPHEEEHIGEEKRKERLSESSK
eukprot:gb/GECG01005275.1/.p1 GENE.gb/GECG01005275.1/~~gb/GECG01005275.1/.p1  ORF type:complete len:489 (+),score=83.67 gb/GECG01005275.1/:1-1467(+)